MPGCPGPSAGARLLAALAALVVLLSWDAGLPRLADQAPSLSAAPAQAASGATSMEAPGEGLLVRAATFGVAPAAGGPGAGLVPGPAPLLLPRLVALETTHFPLRHPLAAPAGAPGSRAPPASAGT